MKLDVEATAYRIVVHICAVVTTALFSATACYPQVQVMPGPNVTLIFERPMEIKMVRLRGQVGCEPNCTEWIAAQGRIENETPAQFQKMLTKLGNRKGRNLILQLKHNPLGQFLAHAIGARNHRLVLQRNSIAHFGWRQR